MIKTCCDSIQPISRPPESRKALSALKRCCRRPVAGTSDTATMKTKEIRLINSATKRAKDKECWEWPFRLDSHGYGCVSVGAGRHGRVHRIVWEAKYFKIPKGLIACHSCDNKKCYNPNHIFIGTFYQNSLDAVRKGRIGFKHRNGEDINTHVLTEKDVRWIRNQPKVRGSGVAISKRFGINPSAISSIRNGLTWRHIT